MDDQPFHWDFTEIMSITDGLETDALENSSKPSALKKWEQLLKTNVHYFLHWCNESKLPLENASERIIRRLLIQLLELSSCPRSKSEIKNYVFSKFNGLEEIVLFFVEAFLRIESKVKFKTRFLSKRRTWASGATICLWGIKQLVEEQIREGRLNDEYYPAVKYLGKWVRLHILVAKGKFPTVYNDEEYDWEMEFQNMPPRSQSLVYGTKAVFVGAFRQTNIQCGLNSCNVLRQAVQLDPTSYEWHYKFQNWLRFSRRRTRTETLGLLPPPSEEEAMILWETFEACDYNKTVSVHVKDKVKTEDAPVEETVTRDSNMRNMALAGLLQGVAEMIAFKFRTRNNDYPVVFGGLTFSSEAEMANYVTTNCQRFLEDPHGHTFAEYIRFAEILGNILPWEYRDFKTAELYYKKAYNIWPTNSKVNHKLGLLFLVTTEGDKAENLKNATLHLHQAVVAEITNFPAMLDLLKTFLSSHIEYKAKIEKLFKIANRRVETPDKEMSQIKLIEGCYKFLLGEACETMQCWIQAITLNPSTCIFTEIQRTAKRHRWDFNKINLDKVEDFLKIMMTDPETTENDLILVKAILNAAPARRASHLRNWKDSCSEWDLQNSKQKRVSESDRDADWRRTSSAPAATSTKLDAFEYEDGKVKSQKYIPPHRKGVVENQNSTVHGNSNSFRVTEQPKKYYQHKSDYRPKSPTSWR